MVESPRMSVVFRSPDRVIITTDEGSREWVPAVDGVGIVAGLDALREAGGEAWDRVADPAEYLGRDEEGGAS